MTSAAFASSFDTLATAAIADELTAQILGGRVQKALLLEPLTIGLEIYAHSARHYLYATARAEEARVHLTPIKLRRGPDRPTPLLLLLRKYICGGHVTEIAQPGFQRVLRLTVQGPYGPVYLYFEIMGRHSNIILVDTEGIILESVKRVPPRLSRRVVLPQHRYDPPPPQEKTSYVSLTPGRLAVLIEQAQDAEGAPLWRTLVAQIAGVSPLLAREVVYRATKLDSGQGDAEAMDADPKTVLDELAAMMSLPKSSAWQPCIARNKGRLLAFAPYPLTQYSEREAVPTLSEAITRCYAGSPSPEAEVDSYAAVREELRKVIAAGHERLQRQREALASSLISDQTRDELRQKGELILAYSGQIGPGQAELVVDLGTDEPTIISLDPHLSPSENAQRYFREYEKAKGAAAAIPARVREIELQAAYLDQLETDLMLASNRPEIDQVRAALAETGYLREKPPKGGAGSGPGRYHSEDGFLILVGKNSRQNDMLTFERATSHDLWLHAQGIPGSHVIIVTEGKQVPESTLQQAAELAAYYSRGRKDKRVDVDYTLQRNVRRIPGPAPGMVTYRGQKTLRVTPRDWLQKDVA